MAVWGAAAVMLLLPLFAMQITDEVKWHAADFAIFGAMLAAVCGTFELAARMTGDTLYRAAAGVAVVRPLSSSGSASPLALSGARMIPPTCCMAECLPSRSSERLLPASGLRAWHAHWPRRRSLSG